MWLFTRRGFISVVHGRTPQGEYMPNVVVVRARSRSDLLEVLQLALGKYEIEETPERDYRWRAVMGARQWQQLGYRLVNDICYTNFKEAAEKHRPEHDYVTFCHNVWQEAVEYQEVQSERPIRRRNRGKNKRAGGTSFGP